ncbi:MAG: OmpA family protein [Deltaproteobacteria bacterium]|nr:OmpA family protein [Deltaproteobacteria bacterium]
MSGEFEADPLSASDDFEENLGADHPDGLKEGSGEFIPKILTANFDDLNHDGLGNVDLDNDDLGHVDLGHDDLDHDDVNNPALDLHQTDSDLAGQESNPNSKIIVLTASELNQLPELEDQLEEHQSQEDQGDQKAQEAQEDKEAQEEEQEVQETQEAQEDKEAQEEEQGEARQSNLEEDLEEVAKLNGDGAEQEDEDTPVISRAEEIAAKKQAFEEQLLDDLDSLLYPTSGISFLEDLGFKGPEAGENYAAPGYIPLGTASSDDLDDEASEAGNNPQDGKSSEEIKSSEDLSGPQHLEANGPEATAEALPSKPDNVEAKESSGHKSSFSEADFLDDLDSLLEGTEPPSSKSSQSSPDSQASHLAASTSQPGQFAQFAQDQARPTSELDSPDLWPPLPEPDSEMDVLRKLLMERELSQLSFFAKLLTDPNQQAHFMSQVITEALLLRSQRDDKLNTVLGPTVERIFTASVRRNPENLANKIFPVIGPAIRRSISETFMSMLQDINSTLEMSLSLKGLKWRLEALRARKPFSEIVLLHTLLYHVEEIYLIHAGSGLVLDHLVYEGGESRDADLVAGMFTAIQDFVKDSFSVARGDNLDNLRFGDRTIFLRRADPVYMAAIVRGNPPASLTQDLQEALELMVVECAEALDNFSGDVEPFQRARRFFEDFLKVRYQDTSKKPPLSLRLLPLIIIFLLAFFLVTNMVSNRLQENFQDKIAVQAKALEAAKALSAQADEARFERALGILKSEPGLVVTTVTKDSDGILTVVVLRDNLARDPDEILIDEGAIDPKRIRVISRPYVSLDGNIVTQRLDDIIDPLPTVKMTFDSEEGLLTLSGSAPLGWILEARDKALTIPGVLKLDTSLLTDPRTMAMESLVAAINGVVIHFPTNKDEPVPEDRELLVMAVDNISQLEKLASEMQMSVTLIIYGHADATGQDRRNFELSEQRAKVVAAMLYARGSSIPIVNYGLGSQFSSGVGEEGKPAVEDPESRKIELRVKVTQGQYVSSDQAF